MEEDKKIIKILTLICVVPFIIGLFIFGFSSTKKVYPTSEYWVAKDYYHVYEKASGEIVDKIEENEKCFLVGKEIIVESINMPLRIIGGSIMGFFGLCVIGLIVGIVQTSDWFLNLTKKL